jgi:hypothetical protein
VLYDDEGLSELLEYTIGTYKVLIPHWSDVLLPNIMLKIEALDVL